ncbi:hypothetical protein [Natrialba asiatica]|uniref:Uncharacterized protein n=1 Tax=Natrialba asiatica (strain ATCC 700177 / DSM 12278 / JCM 9576 / FERM P-10747 / NBRC 102637 / 172P1) TaxID=29540 RepID=M0AXU4_NATA1|nr:hypothetical protein [Natrialba asiatica]ELZ02803.1 hypothetical protein C481_06352 [Natrialba asiatica DSM 12278]
MTLIVDRSGGSIGVETESESSPETATAPQRERIEVTELDAASIDEFVQARVDVDTDQVSLEHRGARTYLVLE